MPDVNAVTAGLGGTTFSSANAGFAIQQGQAGMGVAGAVGSFGALQSNGGILNIDAQGNRSVNKTGMAIACLQGMSAVAGAVGSVSAAAGPLGAIIGGSAGAVATAIQGGVAAVGAQKTVAKLKQCQAMSGASDPKLKTIIAWAIGKQTSKRDRNIANATAVAGVGVSAHNAIKAIHKFRLGTKGKNREEYATELLTMSKDGNTNVPQRDCAKAVVTALLGDAYEEYMKGALKSAMKST